MDHLRIATNGIRLHVVQAGVKTGPLVILLHGFPEFWYGWRQQIPYLAAAGYRVWAPDQRGYNLSDKPKGISAYNLDTLADDIVGLIDAAGEERAFVCGHDWGAAVAWWMAATYPERLKRMVVLNVPHFSVMRRNLVFYRNPRQALRSWYFLFFQIPRLPEAMARLGNWRQMVSALEGTSRSGTFSPRDIEQYRQAWSQPRAITSMINWYRAILQKPPRRAARPRIGVPTMIIWGARDPFLGRELAQPSIDLCEDGRLFFIEEATHWVQHEEPAQVNGLIGGFLREEEGKSWVSL